MKPDAYTPQSGDPNLRIAHYDLALDYKVGTNRLNATATITGTVRERAKSVSLDLVGLRATRVKAAGHSVSHKQSDRKLKVAFGRALEPDEPFTLTIAYGGSPRPRRTRWGALGWEELADGVLVASQPTGAPTWFPCIAQGVAANMRGLDQSVVRDDGIVDYCRLHDITIQAWSPFQAGFFDGPFLGSDRYPELNAVVDRLAAKYGVPAEAIAVAWITRHPARMQVVLGTTTPERVAAAAQGSDLPLTRAEWYELFRAAGYVVP